jgi:RNA polymerase primary sigma factor
MVRFQVNKKRVIRLSHRQEETLRQIQRAYHTLSQRLVREPTVGELAEEVGISVEEAGRMLNLAGTVASLGQEGDDDETPSLMEFQADNTYNPERALMRKTFRDETLRALRPLQERERHVLIYRYELNGGKRQTLKSIGDRLGISPETVRQIERRALQKLRQSGAEMLILYSQEAM